MEATSSSTTGYGTTLLGYYVFAEQPDIWIWIGGATIVGSATYIAHRETLARRSQTAREV